MRLNHTPRGFSSEFNLSYDGGFSLVLMGGGGVQSAPPPIFICENHRKSIKNMQFVEKKIDLQF